MEREPLSFFPFLYFGRPDQADSVCVCFCRLSKKSLTSNIERELSIYVYAFLSPAFFLTGIYSFRAPISYKCFFVSLRSFFIRFPFQGGPVVCFTI